MEETVNEIKRFKLNTPILAILAIAAISLVAIYPALAAPPGNDDILTPTFISGLPFSDYMDTSEATVAGDDPWPSCNYTGVREATVWYQFTPGADMLVAASTVGSQYTTNLAVYATNTMSETACTLGNNLISFQAVAGQSYSIMIAAVDDGPYPSQGGYGGILSLTLDSPGPPQVYFDYWSEPWIGMYAYYFSNQSYDPAGAGMTANWDFGDGAISDEWSPSHQFPSTGVYLVTLMVNTSDGRTASIQREVTVTEPPPPPPPVADFYPYPSDTTTKIPVQFHNWSYDPAYWYGMNAYWDFGDGNTSAEWSPSHLYPIEGMYTVQLTVTTSDGRSASTQRDVTVSLPPPPNADFYLQPWDPSIYDTINIYNWSNDPGCYDCGMTAAWDFGDGTTSTDWSPNHRYASEGDYTISLTVTTGDGRVGSTTQTLQVRTHDVAITKFTVPQSAKAGQTRSVSVYVNNTRYPEQVEVQLFKSTPAGWQWVGTLQQEVPVRPSNRTTIFEFSYTFTAEDAQLGRINFRAVATIVNARDALPTNNEAISLPTKVAP
jgi:PKD repeat protein